MNSLVVYHSQFGNTRTLAEIIHGELSRLGPARIMTVGDVTAASLEGVALLVVGGPTQAHGTSPVVRPFLQTLKDRNLTGMAGVTFDTRLKGPAFLWGSAAKPAAQVLVAAGIKLMVPPESFLVKGTKEPQLEEGETERARAWAATVGQRVLAGLMALPTAT